LRIFDEQCVGRFACRAFDQPAPLHGTQADSGADGFDALVRGLQALQPREPDAVGVSMRLETTGNSPGRGL
jgi:hypothetical protein